MKKSTLAVQSGAGIVGIVGLALLAAMAQADSARYSDVSTLEFDMANAAMAASGAIPGDIIEAELEMEDSRAIWEIDIVNDTNQVITVEVDGETGQILSTEADDDVALERTDVLSLAKAIEVIRAVEQGALIEAELEQDDGQLIWEVETLGNSNEESEFRIDAKTGEILI